MAQSKTQRSMSAKKGWQTRKAGGAKKRKKTPITQRAPRKNKEIALKRPARYTAEERGQLSVHKSRQRSNEWGSAFAHVIDGKDSKTKEVFDNSASFHASQQMKIHDAAVQRQYRKQGGKGTVYRTAWTGRHAVKTPSKRKHYLTNVKVK